MVSLGGFRKIETTKNCGEKLFDWEIYDEQQYTFCPGQDYEEINFCEKLRLYNIGWLFPDKKLPLFYK